MPAVARSRVPFPLRTVILLSRRSAPPSQAQSIWMIAARPTSVAPHSGRLILRRPRAFVIRKVQIFVCQRAAH
jgi:hypothetical protein